MPIYEFRCPQCGKVVSKLCKIGETGDNLICLECQHKGLKKMISGFAAPGVSGSSGGQCAPGCGGNCAGCH